MKKQQKPLLEVILDLFRELKSFSRRDLSLETKYAVAACAVRRRREYRPGGRGDLQEAVPVE